MQLFVKFNNKTYTIDLELSDNFDNFVKKIEKKIFNQKIDKRLIRYVFSAKTLEDTKNESLIEKYNILH